MRKSNAGDAKISSLYKTAERLFHSNKLKSTEVLTLGALDMYTPGLVGPHLLMGQEGVGAHTHA